MFSPYKQKKLKIMENLKKIVMFIVVVVIFSSCGNLATKEDTPNKINADSISKLNSTMREIDSINAKIAEDNKPYHNPALIYGSSFGNMFQAFYKLGAFGNMLKFTSAGTIKKFGQDKILKFYSEMDFGYKMQLKSMSGGLADTMNLNYEANINATKKILRMRIVIENDSAKIVLKNLKGL